MNGYLESHAKTSVISLTLNTIVPSTSGLTRNCFGYLSNSSHSALTDQKSFNIFGYFNCLIPKPSCSIVSFPIQCFSSQRPPFQTIFLNDRFAAMYGLSDGVEILLEPIQNLQKCTSIEFMPLSYEDWNIIEQSAYQIEEFLLHQIRVVQQDMRVILFLGTSISIKLRVESTSPPSDEGPALVMSTDTLVLVAPLKNSSTNIWNSIIPKTDTGNWSILQDVEDIDSYDIKPFIKCSSAQQMFRVLPASFTDSDVTSQLFNVVVVLYEKQDRTVYSKAQIVKLESYETQLSTCAVLIQLASPTANFIPQNSNGHDDVLLKLAGNLLKANENNKVKHCWISPAMSKLFSDCTWLSVDYLVEEKELQKIERLEVPFYSQQLHQQLEVLSSLLNVKLASDTIEKDINFNIGELVNIAQSVAFKTANKKDIRVEDVQEAIQNMPTAGQPVQKCRDDKSICFADIAGLHEVKQKLVEIFIWPNKYAQLFANCGIAMGRGVILHGPSGCGKSMLMRALACECNFNVITIKGPELLSKYIGQSEENVRKVFERARASRPCILAFDEFDSLAPVRGHDSTGVTDRVVNQLLTEMDGVESGMEGLFVLAATNRIALIDQALLRPGRFDHKVLVDLPNEEDRLAILQIHSSGLFSPSNSDVNLFQIAKATDGWSGSELRGLLVNAHFQMLAEEDTGVNTPTNGQLQQKHLEQVFQSSAPKSNRRKENAKPSQKSTVNPKRVTQA
uniref:Peroxisomal ATPase PEX1 n=1 Tax=Ditylenchus dipsaci TaxID=166011 RepID=A0A915EDE9_9BILA